jgi:lysyl-tRNA synthetase class I
MIFRVMLVGSKMGPSVAVIAETIGKAETIKRIKNAIRIFG